MIVIISQNARAGKNVIPLQTLEQDNRGDSRKPCGEDWEEREIIML